MQIFINLNFNILLDFLNNLSINMPRPTREKSKSGPKKNSKTVEKQDSWIFIINGNLQKCEIQYLIKTKSI